MNKKSSKPSDTSNAQLFVYGLDETGKPKGARFPAAEAEKVLPVASVAVIVAPGMTAPVSSVTRPRSGIFWASAVSAATRNSRSVTLLNLIDLYKCILTSFAWYRHR